MNYSSHNKNDSQHDRINHGKNQIDVGKGIEVYWSSDETYYPGKIIQKKKKQLLPELLTSNQRQRDYQSKEVWQEKGQQQQILLFGDNESYKHQELHQNRKNESNGDDDKSKDNFSQHDNEYGYLVKYEDGYQEWIDLSKMKTKLMDEESFKRQQEQIHEAKNKVAQLTLHSKLLIWWPYEKKYFPGVLDMILDCNKREDNHGVNGRNQNSDRHGPHHIRYDDGDEEWTNLIYRDFKIEQIGTSNEEVKKENNSLQLQENEEEQAEEQETKQHLLFVEKKEQQKKIEDYITAIQELHKLQVQKMMKECSERGLYEVPTDELKPWRVKHLAQMTVVLKTEHSTLYDNDSLAVKLCQAETNASKAYLSEIEKMNRSIMEEKINVSPKANDVSLNILDQRSPFDQQQLLLVQQLLERQKLEQFIKQQELQQRLEHRTLWQELHHQQARNRQNLQQLLEKQQYQQSQLDLNLAQNRSSFQNLSNYTQRQDINPSELLHSSVGNFDQLSNTQVEALGGITEHGLQINHLPNSQSVPHQSGLNLATSPIPNHVPLRQETAAIKHSLLMQKDFMIGGGVGIIPGQAAQNAYLLSQQQQLEATKKYITIAPRKGGNSKFQSSSITPDEIKMAQVGRFDDQTFVHKFGGIQQKSLDPAPCADEMGATKRLKTFDEAHILDLPSADSDSKDVLQQDSFDPVSKIVEV